MPLCHCGALQLTKELSVSASGSQPRVTSSFRGHVTMSEDISDWHRGGGGGECYWHVVGRSWGYCQTCYMAQKSTHNKELSSQKCAEVKKNVVLKTRAYSQKLVQRKCIPGLWVDI